MSTASTQLVETGAQTWQIDPTHTEVGFQVRHMMFAKVRGRFQEFEGTIALVPDDLTGSGVNVVIRSASIDTGQGQRDDHLRSPDFFDVERFPELRFESRDIRPLAEDRFAVTGDLTIRGVTREVELIVDETGSGTDPWGNERVGYSGATTIDRRDFGLTWNQALETGGVLVGNEVEINLEVQAVREAEQVA